MTNAQLELMAVDVSITTIPKNKNKSKGKSGKNTNTFRSPSARELEEAANKWKEKYAGGKVSINLNDYT